MAYRHIEFNNRVSQIDPKTGFYNLEADKLAIEEYQREIDDRTVQFTSELQRLKWLVEENYYYDLFAKYQEEDVISLLEELLPIPFKFQSYMAMTKFYTSYAMMTRDKKQFLENYNQRVFIVALYLANGNKELAREMFHAMIEQRVQPATPTFN